MANVARLGITCLVLGSVCFAQTPLHQISYLKASNTHMGDHFGDGGPLDGHAVALSGDGRTLAVGAQGESSGAKGIGGNQNDTSLYGAGAVYIFIRSGTQ